MTDPSLLPATELATMYAQRELSPVEATTATLARIERHDRVLNAYCLVAPEAALEAAEAAEDRCARGVPLGPLDGVPVAVKDVFLTKGWPTLRGSCLIDPDQPWDDDSPAVAALRDQGAVLVGKTTTPELGWKGVTDSPLYGITRNPWDPERTSGGSSGGSSAALVCGMATLALGTDGGGSVRIPAGFCGHPGLKPTHGRIPVWPQPPYGTLAHVGPMARTVEDCALMLDVISRPDPRDPTALPPSMVAHAEALRPGIKGLRVAFSPDLGYADVDPEVAGCVDGAVKAFEELGARVEIADPPFDDPVDTYSTLWNVGAAQATRHRTEDDKARMDPGLVEIVTRGANCSGVDYVEAMVERNRLTVDMNHFFAGHDLLLTPTLPIGAFEAGREVPSDSQQERWMSWTPFSYPFNLTTHPAATVPCGFTSEGLPVGIQIVGPRFSDGTVLRAAHAYEQFRGGLPWPTMVVDELQGRGAV
jgi:aspartyl-tRNA(Asn)/glutamyl-tRNA(Gln) amidotransferase subunit A